MQTTLPSEVPRITGWLLGLALAGVIAVFAVANIISGRHAALTQAANGEIVEDALWTQGSWRPASQRTRRSWTATDRCGPAD
jgi:hypothetical protein